MEVEAHEKKAQYQKDDDVDGCISLKSFPSFFSWQVGLVGYETSEHEVGAHIRPMIFYRSIFINHSDTSYQRLFLSCLAKNSLIVGIILIVIEGIWSIVSPDSSIRIGIVFWVSFEAVIVVIVVVRRLKIAWSGAWVVAYPWVIAHQRLIF